MKNYDVIVLGGGAAGLMCAVIAGQRGRRVAVLEGSNKVGKKILMSGGGRCNFTNMFCEPENFLSQNPSFCISALSRYTPWDFIALVEKHQIPFHEKSLGQLFCDRSSKDILEALVNECEQVGVDIFTRCDINSVTHNKSYSVQCQSNGGYSAESLVVATGGLSIPTMGASDFGYRLARQFGLNVLPTRAGLVPFTFSDAISEVMQRLSGVSLPATLTTGDVSFSESVLFTHRGLSGPASLQLSSYWQLGEPIFLNLLPDQDAQDLLIDAKQSKSGTTIRKLLTDSLPKSLVVELEQLWWPDIAQKPLAEIPNEELLRIGENLNSWKLKPSGTEGYRTAEVTLGGIDTDELSSKTMECKHQQNLYCIGEVVDVSGHLGGFNFQWAWASANAAGQVV